MKKIFFGVVLIVIFAVLAPISTVFASADGEEFLSTDIFLPTSYLEYYKLQNPYAICKYDDGGEVIAISHDDAIVIYRNEKFYSIPLAFSATNRVKTLAHYKNYLLYAYDLNIYAIDLNGFNGSDWQAEIVNTGIQCLTFSVCGNTLLTATGDNLYFYEIDEESQTFGVKTPALKQRNATKTSNVLLTESGKVYYTSADDSDLMSFDVDDNSEEKVVSISNIRFLADGKNGKIYFSSSDGVYEVNGNLITTIASASEKTEDADLGKIYNPYGVCLTDNGTIWVVDGDINAVQEINVKDKTFTQFAITTNSNAVNRLSARASDLCVDDDHVFALDGNRIVSIKISPDNTRSYGRITLEDDDVSIFAAGDEKVCYAVADKIKLFSFKDVGEPDFEVEKITEINRLPDNSGTFVNISDVYYSEDVFYILRTVYDGGDKPEIYTLSSQGEITKLNLPLPLGEAKQIVVDVFGQIYYLAEKDGNYEFYGIRKGSVEKIFTTSATSKIKNLQTDFDGSLYYLTEGNKIGKIYGGELTEKTLSLSPNLVGVGDAQSACLSYRSENAYFIFSGLILKTATDDLDVATPGKVVLPEDFDERFVSNPTFVRPEKGTKMFEVSKSSDLFYGGYFNADGETVYAVKNFGKYSYAACEGTRVILRSADAENVFGADNSDKDAFAVVSFNAFAVPVCESRYTTRFFDKFEKLKVSGEIQFNGRNYSAVSCGGRSGFIPSDFLIFEILPENGASEIFSAYFYDKYGVPLYADAQMTETQNTLTDKTKLAVVNFNDDKYAVLSDGKIAFTESKFVVNDGRSDIIKAAITILVALTLFVTALFLERRFLFRDKKKDDN